MTRSESGTRPFLRKVNKIVTVYSKPSCVQCNATYRKLDELGLLYEIVDVTEDTDSYEYITGELGYLQAPVVVTYTGAHWSGYRPDLIEAL